MWFLRFLKSNILYIIWFIIYFTLAWWIFGANLDSFIVVSIIYAVSMSVALSPIGEILLRGTEGCREPATENERQYLLPIFEEVYESAKKIQGDLNKGIKIYIVDMMFVNAFAMGRKTIAVTRGALETFTADELKGILAHELGHMTRGHTKALLLTLIGNFLFTVIVLVLRLILKIAQILAEITACINVIGFVFWLMAYVARIVFEISTFLFVNAGELFLSVSSRANESEADTFAYKIGFGGELIAALYLLQKVSIGTRMKLSQKLKSSHPHIAYRIGALERKIDMAEQV